MKIFLGSIIAMVLSFTVAGVLFKVTDFDNNELEQKLKRFNIHFDKSKNTFMFTTSDNLKFDYKNAEVIKQDFAVGTVSMIDVKGINTADVDIKDVKEGSQIKVELECASDFLKSCQEMIELKEGVLQIFGKPIDGATNFIKSLKIFLPPNAFNLNLALGVGDVTIKNVVLAKANISVGTGDIEVSKVKAESIVFQNGTGDIELKALDVTNLTQIKSGIGNVELEVLNASPIVSIESGTGSIEFKSPEKKNFTLEVKMGLGSKDLASGYTASGDQYVYGKGEGKVMIKSGVGDIEVN